MIVLEESVKLRIIATDGCEYTVVLGHGDKTQTFQGNLVGTSQVDIPIGRQKGQRILASVHIHNEGPGSSIIHVDLVSAVAETLFSANLAVDETIVYLPGPGWLAFTAAGQIKVTSSSGDSTPAGVLTPFAGSAAPTGWLLCDGSEVSRTTYAGLFTVVGVTYGAGDGVNTFNLPNLRGRVPVGRDAAQSEFDVLGETGGAKTHTLTTSEMPSHAHSVADHDHTIPDHIHSVPDHLHDIVVYGSEFDHFHLAEEVAGRPEPTDGNTGMAQTELGGPGATDAAGAGTTDPGGAGPTSTEGGGSAHNNLQPYIALNYIIKT